MRLTTRKIKHDLTFQKNHNQFYTKLTKLVKYIQVIIINLKTNFYLFMRLVLLVILKTK